EVSAAESQWSGSAKTTMSPRSGGPKRGASWLTSTRSSTRRVSIMDSEGMSNDRTTQVFSAVEMSRAMTMIARYSSRQRASRFEAGGGEASDSLDIHSLSLRNGFR